MLEGYKSSLSYINKLMWTVLSLSLGILLLDSSATKINVLGLSFDQSLITIIGPVAILGLLLVRQIVIRNAADIVNINKSQKDVEDILKLTKAYPILEFIRWRAPSGIETILLSIFQALADAIPAISICILLSIRLHYSWYGFIISVIAGILVARVSLWNYKTLRRKVYEPLCGSIQTPD